MLKYLVFWVAASGVPALAWLLSLERRWLKWAFFGMVAGLCLYQPTAINFFSHERYSGTARGMEVSLIHLLALAVLLALSLRGKRWRLFPDGGFALYGVYFLLCLPSLFNADSVLIGWLEVWKMMLLFVFGHAVYGYLSATDDVETVVKALAVFTIANFLATVHQHYTGVFQSPGVFPHRNGMGMGMNLLGSLFFAGYLQRGLKDRLGRLSGVAFLCAAVAGMWTYSRGAIAVLPVGYGLAALGVLRNAAGKGSRTARRVLLRMLPMALAGLLGLAVMWPRLVQRFTEAPVESSNTRVELAACAKEMIQTHPWIGVGINNWSLNMGPDHPYQDLAAEKLGRELNYRGIVETVYLLVAAECGIPALVAMLVWFGWYWVACARLGKKLRGGEWHFVPAGLLGGLTANYLQSALEWVLRQQMSLFLLVFLFAMVAYFDKMPCKPQTDSSPS